MKIRSLIVLSKENLKSTRTWWKMQLNNSSIVSKTRVQEFLTRPSILTVYVQNL